MLIDFCFSKTYPTHGRLTQNTPTESGLAMGTVRRPVSDAPIRTIRVQPLGRRPESGTPLRACRFGCRRCNLESQHPLEAIGLV